MDAIQIGSFLGELRKQKELKQKEVAEALQVSDKAISRWETGRGIPDVDSLQRLSDFYGVSINEILAGRRIEKNEVEKVADQNLKVAVKKQSFLKRKLSTTKAAVIVLLVLLAVLVLAVFPVQHCTVSLVSLYCVSDESGEKSLEEAFRIVDGLKEEGIEHTVSMETIQGERFIRVMVYFPEKKYYRFFSSAFRDSFNGMNQEQIWEYLKKMEDERVNEIMDDLKEIGYL